MRNTFGTVRPPAIATCVDHGAPAHRHHRPTSAEVLIVVVILFGTTTLGIAGMPPADILDLLTNSAGTAVWTVLSLRIGTMTAISGTDILAAAAWATAKTAGLLRVGASRTLRLFRPRLRAGASLAAGV